MGLLRIKNRDERRDLGSPDKRLIDKQHRGNWPLGRTEFLHYMCSKMFALKTTCKVTTY